MTDRQTLVVVLGAGLAAVLIGCAAPIHTPSVPPEGVINVWVSVVPQRYFVERIGGHRVRVSVMVEPGSNPATYEPKPGQIEGLGQAQLYVRIRVPFEEAWMDRILAANDEMLVVDQSEGIERIEGKDPHIWLSPRLAKTQARTIFSGLAELDPANEDFYRVNLDTFLADLDELDATIQDTLSGLNSRKFMVFHPAWAYFARDYDLEMIPVQIEGSDPSAAEMAALIKAAQESKIKVIFAQPEFSTERAGTIASEIRGEVVLISPLAPDYLENLQRVADTFATVLAAQK